MSIDPRAIVSSRAKIGSNVEIGPFCIIESDVEIGDGCRLESNISIKSGTILGENNQIHNGTVIGGPPQHTSATGPFGNVVIGNNNVFRENVTIHRAMKESSATIIGDECYLMVNAHVAHDCTIGNNVVLVNNVMVAGHVQIGNRANLGGGAAVHQFCRVGAMVMVGGQAHVIQDVPPFVTVDGLTSRIVGLNQIGLRRSGKTTEEIKTLKAVYRLVFRSGLTWREILDRMQKEHSVGPGAEVTQFLLETKRGIVSERNNAARRPLRLHSDEKAADDNDEEIRTLKVAVG